MYQNVKWTPEQEAELERIWDEMVQQKSGEETEKMSSTQSSPNATVGTVHHSSPQGAITIRPRGSNLPKASPRAKRPKSETLHDPVRRGQHGHER